ncbi:hypothetical protein N7462_002956 [Penicillium macrosclerotiorum]|uniref:uncharacterized protein n=1 Tax=Penicillium macrosclerotiorum TaxID=303699 RepID=UPI002546E353|nr:uncharacterized protein N7462_002956 [Penicillium macrosclerotiorum]KAJ5688564.1 hypothetical protein N7462_002956 [Penicillium macrosclerotiorum]
MADQASPAQTFTSVDRIQQLNDIDQDVAKLIHSAGLAIQALTNTNPDPSSEKASLESHKTQFKEATKQYFALLSSIDVRLRRQVYAIDEVGLGPEAAAHMSDTPGAGPTSGASNPLDVSWLNSRKDIVGKDKEAELWAETKVFLERLEQAPSRQSSSVSPDYNPENMQVD